MAVFIFPPLQAAVSSIFAGYIARRKGVLVGVLSSLLLIGALFYCVVMAVWGEHSYYVGSIHVERWAFIMLPVILLVSGLFGYIGVALGGIIGDYDDHMSRPTLFGIYWPHYFWSFPFVIYPFMATMIILIYSIYQVLRATILCAISPSKWHYLTYEFSYNYIAIIIAISLVWYFIRVFVTTMNHRNRVSKWNAKVGIVLLCIICGTVVPWVISAWLATTLAGIPAK